MEVLEQHHDLEQVRALLAARDVRQREPRTGKLKAARDEMIPMFRREDIHVAVVDGETNGYWRIMGCDYQKTVSVDEWR